MDSHTHNEGKGKLKEMGPDDHHVWRQGRFEKTKKDARSWCSCPSCPSVVLAFSWSFLLCSAPSWQCPATTTCPVPSPVPAHRTVFLVEPAEPALPGLMGLLCSYLSRALALSVSGGQFGEKHRPSASRSQGPLFSNSPSF